MYVDFENNRFRLTKEEKSDKDLAKWYFDNHLHFENLLYKVNWDNHDRNIVDAEFELGRFWENYKNTDVIKLQYKNPTEETNLVNRLDKYLSPYLENGKEY